MELGSPWQGPKTASLFHLYSWLIPLSINCGCLKQKKKKNLTGHGALLELTVWISPNNEALIKGIIPQWHEREIISYPAADDIKTGTQPRQKDWYWADLIQPSWGPLFYHFPQEAPSEAGLLQPSLQNGLVFPHCSSAFHSCRGTTYFSNPASYIYSEMTSSANRKRQFLNATLWRGSKTNRHVMMR